MRAAAEEPDAAEAAAVGNSSQRMTELPGAQTASHVCVSDHRTMAELPGAQTASHVCVSDHRTMAELPDTRTVTAAKDSNRRTTASAGTVILLEDKKRLSH